MYFHVIKINRLKGGPEVSFDDIIIFGSVEVIIFDTYIEFKISFAKVFIENFLNSFFFLSGN